MELSNKLYDILKYIATIIFPAIEALWLSIGGIWNLPYTTPIGATIAAVGIFIGAIIGISSARYNKGDEKSGNN